MGSVWIASAALLCTTYCVSAITIDGAVMSIDEAIVKAGSNASMSKMFEIMQDENTVLIELDMLYKMDAYREMVKDMIPIGGKNSRRTKRKAKRSLSHRWTNQRIPYEIAPDFSAKDRATIKAAIDDYDKYTCLRFVPTSRSDKNKVRFQNGGGCSSFVGMTGDTQPINLASGCRHKGIIIHEMGHAAGFNHEQSRPDRDSYVYVNSANIQRGAEYNFMKYTASQVNTYGVPYDYTSVMHYSGTAFSKNGRQTITARDSQYQSAMGNRDGLSYRDIQLANIMYSCASVNRCAPKSCPRGFQGKDCKCWCGSGNRNSPIKECGGTVPLPGVKTTPEPVQPANCRDMSGDCARWASQGWCNGRNQNYVRGKCAYSCNICKRPVTVKPRPSVPGCRDESKHCRQWAENGECSRNPSYMLNSCKRSCKACRGSKPDCVDTNPYCPLYKKFCNDPSFSDYLSANCMRTCRACSSRNEVPSISSPDTLKPMGNCRNRWSDQRCDRKLGVCGWNSHVKYNCEKTCGVC